MIYEQLMGGMGNQIFIYAFCKKLVQSTGQEAILYFDSEDARQLEISKFLLDQRIRIENKKFLEGYDGNTYIYRLFRKLIEHTRRGAFQSFLIKLSNRLGIVFVLDGFYDIDFGTLQKRKKIIVNGFFQSQKYFEGMEEDIRNEFNGENLNGIDLPPNVVSKLNDVRNSNSTCVHIRRGDYLDSKYRNKFLVCTEEYYKRAMEYINVEQDRPRFVVFSDDIHWVINNYKFLKRYDVDFVDNGGELAVLYDFLLMKECKHFILSNSTLSWWAQFLSDNGKKVVVAPSRWLNDDYGNKDIYQDTWHLIDPD
ncbi:MAG: alpha-1,2-fucosyltransferase [Acetatifactor sp.]|nr:alpha-1,2-fucosyltransferase [Acetatifactor sp.]